MPGADVENAAARVPPMGESRRVAVVTGASTGIGAAVVERLAAAGWNVAVAYRENETDAIATAARCERLGAEAVVVGGDVSVDADCRRIAQAALGKWRRIDALVNNAGTTVFADARRLEALAEEDFRRLFAVNATGAYLMTRACEPALRTSPVASVVNVSSHGAFTGLGSSIAYAASKGALNTLTLALARALAPEIRVNAICPGFVDTRWILGAIDAKDVPAFKKRVERIAPLKRMPGPEDVAEAVEWFLAGGRAITGQLLVIDGGVHLTVASPVAAEGD